MFILSSTQSLHLPLDACQHTTVGIDRVRYQAVRHQWLFHVCSICSTSSAKIFSHLALRTTNCGWDILNEGCIDFNRTSIRKSDQSNRQNGERTQPLILKCVNTRGEILRRLDETTVCDHFTFYHPSLHHHSECENCSNDEAYDSFTMIWDTAVDLRIKRMHYSGMLETHDSG